MIMIRSPILRASSVLLTRISAPFGGGVHHKAFLDPHKHVSMYKYGLPSLYEDYWPTGFYPETYTVGSVASAAYQAQAEKILIEELNKKYNSKVTIEDIFNENVCQFFKRVLKTQQSPKFFLRSLNERLSKEIIVKQSRWTWVRQQRQRESMSQSLLVNQDFQTFKQFLQSYNTVIEKMVQISNLGLSKIPQEQTAQQKHLINELNNNVTGIAELNDTQRPENNNFINRFLRMIHTL